MKISITVGNVTLEAELFETESGKKIYDALPIESEINVWGDEFYFRVPLSLSPDDTYTKDVNVGDIGYWPPGRALAIFFGPTPLSKSDKPVPASEVNIVGRVLGDAKILKSVKGEKRIRIDRA